MWQRILFMIVRDLAIQHDPRAGAVSSILHDLSHRASSMSGDRDIFEAVADGFSEVLRIDRLSVVLIEGDSEPLTQVFRRGSSDDNLIVRGRSDPLIVRCMTSGHAVLHEICDNAFDTPVDGTYIERGFRQVVVCPILIDDQHHGLLEIASKDEHRFTGNDLWVVETISSTLGLMLAGQALRREAQARARGDALLRDLGHLMRSRPLPDQVLKYAAERIGTTVDCDVLMMRRDNGAWIGEEPFVRDPTLMRARRALLNRFTNVQAPVQFSLRHAETSSHDTTGNEARDLAELVSRIEELLEREDIYRSVLAPFTPETGGPLILAALRSNQGDREFSAEDRSAIGLIMRYVTPALVNATLDDDLSRALGERDAIHRMSTAIGSGKNTLDRTRIACRTAQLLLACDYVALTDWSTQPPNLRFVVGSTISEPLPLSRAGTITAVRRSGDVRIINDFPNDPPVKVAWYPLHMAEGLRASLTYRLQWSGKTVGSLVLGFRRPRHFPATDLRFGESLAMAIVASLGPELNVAERRQRP
jgi:GAF domain-containing protein